MLHAQSSVKISFYINDREYPDRLVLEATLYDADVLAAHMILGNTPEQKQKYHL